jgi:hypothetical protein
MCRSRRGRRQKLEAALRLRLLGDRRRMVRNLLPMPKRVLQDLNTVHLDVREVVAGVPRRGCGSPRHRAAPSTADQPSPWKRRSSIIARNRDAPKRGYLDSNRNACQPYFTGMIIGYPFGVITVITHRCMSVLLVLDAQCTYAGLSGGEYALTVKPRFMGIDGLPNSCMTPVPSSTYARSCPGW